MKPDVLKGYKYKPRVFIDVEINNVPCGRITIHLDWDRAPFTAENFRALCTNASKVEGQTYQGTVFHRMWKGHLIQGGDYENGDGSGGASVYGKYFNDERLDVNFTHRGQVAMANKDRPHSNGSQFFITFDAIPQLNGKAVIFGQIVDRESFEVLKMIEDVNATDDFRPQQQVMIYECGELASS